ncbi:hypothetical protein L4X63_02625 [Geomonas sp. Red32]|uniref:hypothetical protein n=1 Tax=Geomonas sp. Red32 TaxID=2912856 RepID=UPI00202CFD17|nr:hypothetical protein [Geomonas sp. Red32]MCM0080475.1 hypothetical protein [Geomonas sp. Red32]
MRKVIGLMAMVLMLSSTQSFGGMFDMIGGAKKDSGQKVDVKALTAREATIKLRVNAATVTLAGSVAQVQKACGMAAEAAKLEATIEEAKKNPQDMEKTKVLCSAVNNAGSAINKLNLASSINLADARTSLGKSLLLLGAGSLLDLQAVNDAKGLTSDISKGINDVKSSPTTYGFSAVKDLTSGLSTAKFVAETIPGQLGTITDLSKGLVKYAQANKIPLPTEKEKSQLADDLQPK